ncbi:MAG: hypothetical protein NT028_02765 [candidate division Zixibacteria bacterium]|nr:hypothetical protein [candidate division Zixibacteria bacterium]
MIFRVTQKLAKKIKVVPTTSFQPHDNPFLDWTAHLFMVSRRQCIMLTNSRCLYSIVLTGKGITSEKSFVEQGLKDLRDYMVLDGTAYIFDVNLEPQVDSVTFCKAGDRRVLGSMNDFIYQTKRYLLEMGLPVPLVNMRLNEMPMSMLEYRHPKMALLAFAGQLKS